MCEEGSNYVLGVDVGTTTVRSLVYDVRGHVVGQSHSSLQPIMPQPGWCELHPEDVWTAVSEVIREAISRAGLEAASISGLGISCQRASFTCWSALTGKPLHNLITWQDVRADNYVTQWNSRSVSSVLPARPSKQSHFSLTMKALRAGGKLLHWCSGQPRYHPLQPATASNGLPQVQGRLHPQTLQPDGDHEAALGAGQCPGSEGGGRERRDHVRVCGQLADIQADWEASD